ncbi:unnamed protein product, partial [Laminaria digitata]
WVLNAPPISARSFPFFPWKALVLERGLSSVPPFSAPPLPLPLFPFIFLFCAIPSFEFWGGGQVLPSVCVVPPLLGEGVRAIYVYVVTLPLFRQSFAFNQPLVSACLPPCLACKSSPWTLVF